MTRDNLNHDIHQVVHLFETKNYQAAKELYEQWMAVVLQDDNVFENELELEWEEEI